MPVGHCLWHASILPMHRASWRQRRPCHAIAICGYEPCPPHLEACTSLGAACDTLGTMHSSLTCDAPHLASRCTACMTVASDGPSIFAHSTVEVCQCHYLGPRTRLDVPLFPSHFFYPLVSPLWTLLW